MAKDIFLNRLKDSHIPSLTGRTGRCVTIVSTNILSLTGQMTRSRTVNPAKMRCLESLSWRAWPAIPWKSNTFLRIVGRCLDYAPSALRSTWRGGGLIIGGKKGGGEAAALLSPHLVRGSRHVEGSPERSEGRSRDIPPLLLRELLGIRVNSSNYHFPGSCRFIPSPRLRPQSHPFCTKIR